MIKDASSDYQLFFFFCKNLSTNFGDTDGRRTSDRSLLTQKSGPVFGPHTREIHSHEEGQDQQVCQAELEAPCSPGKGWRPVLVLKDPWIELWVPPIWTGALKQKRPTRGGPVIMTNGWGSFGLPMFLLFWFLLLFCLFLWLRWPSLDCL